METTRASGTDWALGIEARSRALLSDGDAAEQPLSGGDRAARDAHASALQLARAHLLYGEWLRRERRRLDAREQLRTAFEMFNAMGIEAFAGRAERELLATGERVRKRTVETREELTAQEAQVARLARDGLSNAEIGERLFISQHTVAYHLRKVFSKLEHHLAQSARAGAARQRQRTTAGLSLFGSSLALGLGRSYDCWFFSSARADAARSARRMRRPRPAARGRAVLGAAVCS